MDLNSVILEGKVISNVTSSKDLLFTIDEINGKVDPLYNGNYCYFLMSVNDELVVEVITGDKGLVDACTIGHLKHKKVRVVGRLVYHKGRSGPIVEAVLMEFQGKAYGNN